MDRRLVILANLSSPGLAPCWIPRPLTCQEQRIQGKDHLSVHHIARRHRLSAALQTEAQGQLQAAEVRQKGLKKQLAEQRRALASKGKEAGGLAQDLQKEQRKVDDCSQRQALLKTRKK